MSNYSVLKQDINNNIYENQTQQITGTVLNAILNEMTASLGAGYQFAGVATLGMNPGDPDQRVFYLAGEGIYTNFGGIQVPAGKLGVLKWDNRWTLQTIDGLGGGGANLTGYVSVASTDDLPDEGQPTLGYLCGTNLYLYVGEGGDTKEGKYQDCGSFRGPEGAYIQDIEQTETSHENGGRNTIKMTLSDGRSFNAYVHNGTTSSGLFPTVAALQAAYPNPVVGQYAFVGAGFPADIYVCTTAGTWTDSGEDYDGDNVDLTDYATKAEVNQLEAKVDDITDEDYQETKTQEVQHIDYFNNTTVTVKGVPVLCGSDGTFTLNATATSSGGRQTPLSNSFTLQSGTYILRSTQISGDGTHNGSVYLMSGTSSVGSFANTDVQITLSEAKSCYIGVNVDQDSTYSAKYKLEVISIEQYTIDRTALDRVARKAYEETNERIDEIVIERIRQDYGLRNGYTFYAPSFSGTSIEASDNADGTVTIDKVGSVNANLRFTLFLPNTEHYEAKVVADQAFTSDVYVYINGVVAYTIDAVGKTEVEFPFDYTSGQLIDIGTQMSASRSSMTFDICVYEGRKLKVTADDLSERVESLEDAQIPGDVDGTNTFIGDGAGKNNTPIEGSDNGHYNTAVGKNAMLYNTLGDHNTAVGFCAMNKNTSGRNNTAIGEDALYQNLTGGQNVAVGQHSGQNSKGGYNVFIGSNVARELASGDYNVIIGAEAYNSVGQTGCSSVLIIGAYAGNPGNYDGVIVLNGESPTSAKEIRIGKADFSAFIIGNKKLNFNQDGTVTWEDVTPTP